MTSVSEMLPSIEKLREKLRDTLGDDTNKVLQRRMSNPRLAALLDQSGMLVPRSRLSRDSRKPTLTDLKSLESEFEPETPEKKGSSIETEREKARKRLSDAFHKDLKSHKNLVLTGSETPEELEQKAKACEEAISLKEKQTAQYEEKLRATRRKNGTLQHENFNLQNQIKDKQKKASEERAEVTRLQAKTDLLEEKAEGKASEVEMLTEELRVIEKEIENVRKAKGKNKVGVNDLNKLKERLRAAQDELESKKAELEDVVEDSEEQVEQANDRLRQLKQEAKSLESRVSEIENRRKDSQKKTEESRKRVFEQQKKEIADVKEQLSRANRELEHLRRKMARVDKDGAADFLDSDMTETSQSESDSAPSSALMQRFSDIKGLNGWLDSDFVRHSASGFDVGQGALEFLSEGRVEELDFGSNADAAMFHANRKSGKIIDGLNESLRREIARLRNLSGTAEDERNAFTKSTEITELLSFELIYGLVQWEKFASLYQNTLLQKYLQEARRQRSRRNSK